LSQDDCVIKGWELWLWTAMQGCEVFVGAFHVVEKSSCSGSQVLDKTKMCKFHARGRCARGKACSFAHGVDELLTAPNLHKTQLCADFARDGQCRRGARCKFAHGVGQLRPLVSNRTQAPQHQTQVHAVYKVEAQADVRLGGGVPCVQAVCLRLEELQHETEHLQMQLVALRGSNTASKNEKDREVGELCDFSFSRASTEEGEEACSHFSRQTSNNMIEDMDHLADCSDSVADSDATFEMSVVAEACRDSAAESGLSCTVLKFGSKNGLKLSVKNTFIVADDVPPAICKRSISMPATLRK